MKNEIGERFKSIADAPSTEIERCIYEKYTDVFADEIVDKFKRSPVSCVDFGGGHGVLIKQINNYLPGKLRWTNVDHDKELLSCDTISRAQVCASLQDLPYIGHHDCGVMRYVLQYNSKQDQLHILKNVRRTIPKGLFLLQHCGAVDEQQQCVLNELFSGVIPKLKRESAYWTREDELLELLHRAGFKTRILCEYEVPVGDFYKRRYDLTDEENRLLLSIEKPCLRYSIVAGI